MAGSRWFWLSLGALVGLAIGVSVSGVLPAVPVHAVATHGQDNFAICTGPIDSNIEAVYFLDFLTGDLRAAVLSIQSRKFTAYYEHNVLADFQTGIKNPRFLVVTGVADLRRGVPSLGQSVVYVAEASSGQVNAYGLPWVTGRPAMAMSGKNMLVPLDRVKFRTAAIRNPQ